MPNLNKLGVKFELLEACSGTTIGVNSAEIKLGVPWWSLSGVKVSCDEIETEEKERT